MRTGCEKRTQQCFTVRREMLLNSWWISAALCSHNQLTIYTKKKKKRKKTNHNLFPQVLVNKWTRIQLSWMPPWYTERMAASAATCEASGVAWTPPATLSEERNSCPELTNIPSARLLPDTASLLVSQNLNIVCYGNQILFLHFYKRFTAVST